MITLYIIAVLVAIATYAVTYKLTIRARLLISFLVFLIPSAAATVLVLLVGDRIPPNAVNVQMENE